MSVPTLAVKRKVAKFLINTIQPPNDFWEYAVTTSWITDIQVDSPPPPHPPPPSPYSPGTSNTNEVEQSAAESFAFISTEGNETGSLSMQTGSWPRGSSLPVNNQTIGPMTMSEDDRQNTFIPESHWKILTLWFGLEPTHQLRRRPINNNYMYIGMGPNSDGVLCDKELDFIPIWVAGMNDLVEDKKQNILHVFVWENLAHIFRQVKAVMRIKQNRKLRYWIRIQEDGQDVVWEPLMNADISLITKLCVHFPDLEALMKKRQTQINESFFSGTDVDDVYENTCDVRRPLVDVWFCEKIRSVSIGVEEFGLDLSRCDVRDASGDVTSDVIDDSDEPIESIVTLSSIKNEWDDILASYIDEYTGHLTTKTSAMRAELMTAAKEVVGQKLDELADIRSDFQRRFTLMEAREAAVDCKEKEYKQKEKEMQTRLQTFKKGLDDFKKQKQKWEEDVGKIEDQNKISGSRVTLNIGGYVYTTSLDTLMKEPGSLFTVLFSGRHDTKREPDGSYFIDRDGVHFRYVLNFLRDGACAIEAVPDDLKLIKELVMESSYYQLPQMEAALVTRLGQKTKYAGELKHDPGAFVSV